MASIAKPVPAVVPAVVAVEDASARPLTAIVDIASSPSNNLTTPADDGPRSIAHSQHEIDLISRIRDESDENTYSASGSLFPGDGAQNHGHSQLWNGDNGDYRLQAADLSNGSSFVDQAISISTPFAVDVDLDMDDIATTPTAWDAQHPLAALFNPPGPDPIQRSYTAPATSAFPLTLAERRLQLRNSHFRATPMASSIKPEDTQVKGLSRAANALRTKNFQSLGRASTVSSRLSDLTASDTDELLSSARKPTSNFGSMPSIHASLRHRKSPSMEQAGYIDHLERQISDMSIKLRSYTDPTSEKSHAAIVQRLNAKVRSLENQVSEWEALFDERIRETELVNSRERSSHASQVKSLRDQIEALNHTITNMEEDLDFERKQNTALTLAVTEKKALAMDNAQLAQALTKALGEIAELEAVAQEQEEMMYNNQQQGTLGALMIDVTPKPRSLETFSELNNNNNLLGISMRTNTTTPDVAKTGTAMLYSPTDAAWQTLSPTTSNASTPDMPLKRKMRKFPPGMPGPQQLILSPTHSRRSSGEFLTRGHSRNVSSSRGSPSMEKMAGRHNSLFAELERLQEDGMVTAINDETLSMVGSLAPAEASDAEQQATQQGHSTSPTDTETSDSEDSPKSDPTSPTQSSPSTTASPASSSRLGGSIGYVLFSPFRVTSAMVASIGRGVLSPRSTLRTLRQRAMDQLHEVSELEDSFNSDILFGDQYDEHLRSGGQRFMPQTPEVRATSTMRSHGSGRWTGTGLSLDSNDIMLDKSDSITTSTTTGRIGGNNAVHRRAGARRRSQQQLAPLTSDDEDAQVVFPGSRAHQQQDPNTPCRTRRRPGSAAAAAAKTEGVLPGRSRQDVRERLQQRQQQRPGTASTAGSSPGFGRMPPPYSEYPELNGTASAKGNMRRDGSKPDDGWRTEDSAGEISGSSTGERMAGGKEGDDSAVMWIPESQLRAVRRELEMDRGKLMRAVSGRAESMAAQWTHLLLSVVLAMYVGVTQGPVVAMEKLARDAGGENGRKGVRSATGTPVRVRREVRVPRTE